ncbi:MAG: triple tyrosine motif-containing protein [Candidatus Poribacteria bacterium]
MEPNRKRVTEENAENKFNDNQQSRKTIVNGQNSKDAPKRERLIKIKRTSGEIQYVTRQQLKEIRKQKHEEKKQKRLRNKKIALASMVILFVISCYFGLWLLRRYNNRVSQQNINIPAIPETEPVGRIKVMADVDGAAIYLDGELTSQVTDNINDILLDDVPIGTHSIGLAMPGYMSESKEVEVIADKIVPVDFDLKPQSQPKPIASIKPKDTTPSRTPTNNTTIEIKPRSIEPVDISPPKLVITNGPPVTITDSTVTFVLNSDEPATYSCYLEGYDSDWGEFSSGNVRRYENLKDGSYTFYAKAKDLSGNVTLEPTSSSFVIDTTAPTARIIEGPDGTISRKDVTFKFSAQEPATFSFYLSGYEESYSSYLKTDSKTYYDLPDGDYTFYVKAKDEVGNEQHKPAEKRFTIDTVAPGATITSGPEGLITYNNVTINFSAKNPEIFEYYLSGKEAEFSHSTRDTMVSYNDLPDGSYIFYVRAKDKAGNIDKTPASLRFTIDTVPPKTKITKGPEGIVTYDDVIFVFTANEKVTYSYYLEGYDKGYSDYTSESSKTYHNLPDGNYNFHVKSKDLAENIGEDAATHRFTVKTMETLFKEDFEDESKKIIAGDFNKSDGSDYWGFSKKRHKTGKSSLWCAGATGGKRATNRERYNKNMSAWYEISLDLSYYGQAKISFWYYLKTNNDITDRLSVRVAPKGKASKKDYTGFTTIWEAPVKKNETPAWIQQNLVLNDFTGKPVVIRICFDSDSVIQDEGAYIDDIVITGKYGSLTMSGK